MHLGAGNTSQLGNASKVGNASQLGNTSQMGIASQLVNTSQKGNPSVGNASQLGNTSQLGNASQLVKTSQKGNALPMGKPSKKYVKFQAPFLGRDFYLNTTFLEKFMGFRKIFTPALLHYSLAF
jgi:hypothetical protein